MNPTSPQATTNYLVPASGATHAVPFSGVFTGVPVVIDWRQFAIDQFPFEPQGYFIDNTQGTGDLTISVAPIGWTIVVPAGSTQQGQYPAPKGQTMQVTGDGYAMLVFVDFPVLPNGTQVTLKGTANVNVLSPNPLPVSVPTSFGGLPYQVQSVPAAAQALQGGIAAGATTTGNITPTNANTNLKKLYLSVSGDATMAAITENIITATLNGVAVFVDTFVVPAVAGSSSQVYAREIDFSNCGLNFGAGSLVVTLRTALTTGAVSVNAYAG